MASPTSSQRRSPASTCLWQRGSASFAHVTLHSTSVMSVELFAWISDNFRAPVGYAPIGSLNGQTPGRPAAGTNEFELTIDI